MKTSRTLKTNKHFFPIDVIEWKEVMCSMFSGDTKAVDPVTYQQYSFEEWMCYNGTQFHGTVKLANNTEVKIPLIIAEQRYDRIPMNRVLFPTSAKVWARDSHMCQYSGLKLSRKDRSIDHIKPVSKGGLNEWTNMTTCHRDLNSWKSDNELSSLNLNDVDSFPSEELETWRQRQLTKGVSQVRLMQKPTRPQIHLGLVFDEVEDGWAEFVDHMT